MRKPNGNGSSIVSDRFRFFQGKSVLIRFASGAQAVSGLFLDILPAGRAYFIQLDVNGLMHAISTDDIMEMVEQPKA